MINVRLTDALKIVSVCPWQYLQKSTTVQGMLCIIIWADYPYNILVHWKSPSFMHYGRWMETVCQITGFFYLIHKTVCTEQGCRKGNQLKCKCIFRFFSIWCSNDYESYDDESTAIDDFVGTVSIVFFLFLVTIEDNKGVIRPHYVKYNKEVWEYDGSATIFSFLLLHRNSGLAKKT